jgi:hypothetical protein
VNGLPGTVKASRAAPVIDEEHSIFVCFVRFVVSSRAKGRAELAKKERRFDVVISPTDFILADLSLRIL